VGFLLVLQVYSFAIGKIPRGVDEQYEIDPQVDQSIDIEIILNIVRSVFFTNMASNSY
jgi:hypothetical protein